MSADVIFVVGLIVVSVLFIGVAAARSRRAQALATAADAEQPLVRPRQLRDQRPAATVQPDED